MEIGIIQEGRKRQMKQMVQIQPEEVMGKLVKKMKTYAFNTVNGTSADLDNSTVGEINAMTADTEEKYTFFVLKTIENS